MSRGRNGAAGGAKGARRATVAAPAAVLGGKGRWSARRKMTVVLELLRGAELEATSRKYGVTAATLTRWREAFVEGGEAGLKIRATDGVDEERKTLKSAVANLVMDNELLRGRIRQLEDEAMSRTESPSTAKPYGLARVTAAWGLYRPRFTGQIGHTVIKPLTPVRNVVAPETEIESQGARSTNPDCKGCGNPQEPEPIPEWSGSSGPGAVVPCSRQGFVERCQTLGLT